MSLTSVVVCFGGIWVENAYKGGDTRLMVIHSDAYEYNSFVDKIQKTIGGIDRNFLDYSISCLVGSPVNEYRSVRFDIKDELELQYALNSGVREFYVNVSPMNEEEYDDSVSVDSIDDDITETSLIPHRHSAPPLHDSSPPHTLLDEDTLQNDKGTSRQWVVPGALYHASLFIDEPNPSQTYSCEPLSIGTTYDTKDKLITAVGLHHLVNKVEFCVERSSQALYYVICKHNKRGCHFRMRAVAEFVGSLWRVTHWNGPHTCQMDLRVQCRRTLCSKVIGDYFAPKLLIKDAILKPKEMIAELRTKFGFQIQYHLALAGRNRAIELIHGNSDKSFQLLPSYLYMVSHVNPGSSVTITTDNENVFEHAFMALSASIRGFLSSCRPVIVVDGTHLKGKFKGVMFVAASLDGNEQVYPLAVGIGDKECDKSWIWFFTQLKNTFGCPDGLLFISDQHVSISKAVQVVYPGIPHGLCVVHLRKNLVVFGETVIAMFKKAANCHRKDVLDKVMSALEVSKPSAFNKLRNLDPRAWSLSYCPVRRYTFMTSNCAESINNCLRWARTLPVCTLLECVRTTIGRWFVERREKALLRKDELTKYATEKLNLSILEGEKMEVEAINSYKFSVKKGLKCFIVDLAINSCSCRQFDLYLIPCSHASAAISKANQSHTSYVSSYYTTNTLREIYSNDVNPIPYSDEWIIPDSVKSRVVRVPNNPRQAGRPRTTRIPSFGESSSRSKVRICTRCKQKGHYRSTCSAELPINSSEQDEVPAARSRRPRSCSTCHQTGHTKRNCEVSNNPAV